MEVIALVVDGQCSNQIAKALGIALTTVNTHRRNILDRLELKKTAELVRSAVEQGWV
jgi:DNA-binding NarL/FixJ family response regulator